MRAMKTFLAERPPLQYFIAGLIALAIVFYIDVITPSDLFLSQFYMLTVVLVAWGGGKGWGSVMSVITTAAWMYAVVRQYQLDGRPVKPGYLTVDAILRCLFYVFASIILTAWRDASRKLQQIVDQRTAALQTEIRERQSAQTALHALTAELADAEDAQRRQLAHDIHDAVGQNLSLLKLNLEALRRDLAGAAVEPDSAALHRRLDDEVSAVDGLIEQTRTLTFEIYPAPLDDLGLAPALEWQAEEFHRRSGVDVIVAEHGPRIGLPTPVAHYLFRAIKELIGNAVKHGAAGHVIVSLRWCPTGVRAVVDDDGHGFNSQLPPPAGKRRGLGLPSIRERITALRGSMQIESKSGEGTRIILEVPLASVQEPV
jgi:signal transduction histidine kinase